MAFPPKFSRPRCIPLATSYKQARELFLSRRLVEAYEILMPLLALPHLEHPEPVESGITQSPPIVAAGSRLRTRIFNLYFALLDAIVRLDSQADRSQFGTVRWQCVVANVRDGSIWYDVIRAGFEGSEGNMDVEVVLNLSALLISHSSSQLHTQQLLESYMASTPEGPRSQRGKPYLSNSEYDDEGGRTMPRDLEQRRRLVELYALQLLPRNGEWQFAEGFISLTDVYNEEHKEHLLGELRELRSQDTHREDDVRPDTSPIADRRRRASGGTKLGASTPSDPITCDEQRPKRDTHGSDVPRKWEQDFGINDFAKAEASSSPGSLPAEATGSRLNRGRKHVAALGQSVSKNPRSSRAQKSKIASAFQVFLNGVQLIFGAGTAPQLRTILILFTIILAFARWRGRARLDEAARSSWTKLTRTMGMGVKVSYI